MRSAVAKRGIDHHVAKSGGEALAQMTSELADGGPGRSTFDPLMGMHWAIIGNLSEHTPMGVSVMFADGCPLCEANAGRAAAYPGGCGRPDCNDPENCASPTFYDPWIDRAADDQVTEHVRLFGAECRA
jgi:hypothetical protein